MSAWNLHSWLGAVLAISVGCGGNADEIAGEGGSGPGGTGGTGGGGGEGGGAQTSTTGAGGSSPEGPGFAEVYEKVFVAGGCTNGYCHGGGAGSLSLASIATARGNLLDKPVAGVDCGVAVRVAPGDPDASLLYLKIAPNVAVCGDKMPANAPALSGSQVELVRAWIAAGAPE